MSEVKPLLDALLWQIYGIQQHGRNKRRKHILSYKLYKTNDEMALSILGPRKAVVHLANLNVRQLIDIVAILKVEIRIMGVYLGSVLLSRDKLQRNQEIFCAFVDSILCIYFDDAHPKMRFSLSPPPPKSVFNVKSPTNMHAQARTRTGGNMEDSLQRSSAVDDDAASDYNQWLHAMKLVVRLPGGTPPEFRRKLWLSLAEKYLKSKNVDWSKEEEKCFCEKWREDDEELGIQIVKDLHRTGSNLCTGPAGNINQAKLKRILLGYARYNPEVGYCQGFNMLGALILQVMDKEEAESMKVMIYLVEGVLPTGYFCGSMGGLQADMGVFRELMQTKLPRLAKHLQKLQGPIENAFEPPLTNVFTMQWFLTMFCTCLPMNCVLRVWDLVLIEGSDVLLRTALVLWSLLEERVLNARTADEFYCNMGSYTSELLNGHLIDSNCLIEKIVLLGPIEDITKLREKHLYNIRPLKAKQGLQLYYDDDMETESDEESRLAVATVWGLPWGRRGSHGQSPKQTAENKERIALDISLLKKQYDRLRERQKQAHIILTTACTTTRPPAAPTSNASHNQTQLPVSQLLMGRSAIVTNKGRRVGPPVGAIPPARKPSLPAILQTKPLEKQLRRGETLHWRDTDLTKARRESLTWKEIKADRATLLSESASVGTLKSHKLRSRQNRSDSSSYSEEDSIEENDAGSSTDTSLCDEDDATSGADKTLSSSFENSPKRKSARKHKDQPKKVTKLLEAREAKTDRKRPKSWAAATNDIPFMLLNSDSPVQTGDEKLLPTHSFNELKNEREDSAAECDRALREQLNEINWSDTKFSNIAGDLASTKLGPLHIQTEILTLPSITSTSQLSPMPDITTYLKSSIISPLPTPKHLFLESTNSLGSGDGDGESKKFDVSDDGVTNQYFERVNSVERPNKLELFYSLNDEDSIRNAYDDKDNKDTTIPKNIQDQTQTTQQIIVVPETKESRRRLDLLNDYSEKSSAACIAEATDEITVHLKSTSLKCDRKIMMSERDENIPGENRNDYKEAYMSKSLDDEQLVGHAQDIARKQKRSDPRRLTIARSVTIELENRSNLSNKQLQKDIFHRITNLSPTRTSTTPNFKYPLTIHACEGTLELQNLEKDLNELNSKHIPSTADLEERYKNMEKDKAEMEKRKAYVTSKLQATNNKEHRIRDQMTKQISESGAIESATCRKRDLYKQMSANAAVESEHFYKKQMSGTTLTEEQRLPKQLSNSSEAPQKNSINIGSDKNMDDENTKSRKEQFRKEQKIKDNEQVDEKTATDAGKSDTEPELTQDERGKLKKLPSTAELEERFNKLERQQSAVKTNATKKNKEPPDQIQTEVQLNDVEKKEESFQEDVQVTTTDKSSHKKTTKSEDTPEAQATKEEPLKKRPPSTEELEKRFQALEKQLSCANLKESAKCAKKQMDIEIADETTKHESTNKAEQNEIETENIRSKSVEENETKRTIEECSDKARASNDTPTNETDKNHQQIKAAKDEPPQNSKEEIEIVKSSKKIPLDDLSQSTSTETQFNKRRSSEPPASVELEKRYESLKRRMSTRNASEYESETVEEAMQRIEQTLIEEALVGDVKSDKKHLSETSDPKDKQTIAEKTLEITKLTKNTKEPPTTEDLESRFEALVNKPNTESRTGIHNTDNSRQIDQKNDAKMITEKSMGRESKKSLANTISPTPKEIYHHDKGPKQNLKNIERKPHKYTHQIQTEQPRNKKATSHIPDAPPMPEVSYDNSALLDEKTFNQRRALIEELQSKIQTPANGGNIKPSVVNPQNRKPIMRKAKTNDETSETHANSAYFRSVNNEPLFNDWQQLQQQNLTVRRFSDLPSRSDLQNRLQFLEQKLYKKFTKQRRASDSEVTSRADVIVADQPTTSAKRTAADLEERVQLLEKQLSENSLKLLEAMRAKAEVITNLDISTPRRLSTDTIDATGKELVRYAHAGELDNPEGNSPINISINIKMMLNKEQSSERKKATALPATEEFERRLGVLEQQLKATQKTDTAEKMETALQQIEKPEEETKISGAIQQKDEQSAAEILTDAKLPLVNKFDKDAANEVVKKDDQEVNSSQHSISEKKYKEESPKKAITKSENSNKVISSDTHIQRLQKVPAEAIDSMDRQFTNTDNNPKVTSNSEAENTNRLIKEKEKKSIENQGIIRCKEKEPSEKVEIITRELVHGNQTQNDQQRKTIEVVPAKDQLAETIQDSAPVDVNTEGEPLPVDDKTACSENLADNVIINAAEVGPVDPNKKTLVLLLDNEPKTMKVRRLTRANTEELEGLFQALEKQISERNLIKSEDGKLKHADTADPENVQSSSESTAIANLSKEIAEFTSEIQKDEEIKAKSETDRTNNTDYNWGPDPVKHHLKRKTVYLPSTKELEARFRSLERQIHLLEHVEKIDVEQRLLEIERKIKLQYSLSHEKDLNKFLDLCEGKLVDEVAEEVGSHRSRSPKQSSPGKSKAKSPYTSPAREIVGQIKTSTTPTRTPTRTPTTTPTRCRSPYTSPARSKSRESRASPVSDYVEDNNIPSTANLEYRYRALELKPSKSKENLADKIKRKTQDPRKLPIHPLEMLLDSSPDENEIPTTGELEHRIRMLQEHKLNSPSPTLRSRPLSHSRSRSGSRSRSPSFDELKSQKLRKEARSKALVTYIDRPEPPTADQLDERMRALEKDHCFDHKTQKNFKDFNQKLKDAVSPSLSFEELKPTNSREQSSRYPDKPTTPKSPKSPKSVLRDVDLERRHDDTTKTSALIRSTSPKVIRFQDDDIDDEEYRSSKSRTEQHDNERMVGNSNGVLELIEENNKMLQRILKQTLTDSRSSSRTRLMTSSSEGLDEMGSRLMRETSPLRRTRTHTGVPLRTDDNINERLTSIKNTIKSIDTLCEDKPYHTEKCQRYIDSLFTDSVHFSSKNSLEDLTRNELRSSRLHDYTPAIRVSDHSLRPSDYYRGRTIGSAESLRSTSPLRTASPLHYRSTRDLRRELSPRRRRDEEREEYESSRVRRDHMLPNYFHDNYSSLSSYDSLTKFHKVDRQLDTYKYPEGNEKKYEYTRSASRSPLRSPYGSRDNILSTQQQHNNTLTNTYIPTTTTTTNNRQIFTDRTISPYRQSSQNLQSSYDTYKRSQTPVYSPGKLEIRHTTVTSTFYDRFLVEKQLEKQLSRPPSRSPMVSPSTTTPKSYLDDVHTVQQTTKSNKTAASTSAPAHSIVGTSVISIAITALSNSTPVYTSSTYNTTSTIGLIPRTTSYNYATTTDPATSTTDSGKVNLIQTTSYASPLSSGSDALSINSRIRNCENMLAQFTTRASSSIGASSILTTSTATTTASPNISTTHFKSSSTTSSSTSTSFSASFLPNITYSASTAPIAAASTSASLSTATTSIYTTGVYNPLMSHTMRQSSSTVDLANQSTHKPNP